MANLITQKQIQIVNREYVIRLTASILLVVAVLGVFLLAYVIPYYILLGKNDATVANQFQSVINVENKENVGESAQRIMTRTLDEMKAAEIYNSKVIVTFNKFGQNGK